MKYFGKAVKAGSYVANGINNGIKITKETIINTTNNVTSSEVASKVINVLKSGSIKPNKQIIAPLSEKQEKLDMRSVENSSISSSIYERKVIFFVLLEQLENQRSDDHDDVVYPDSPLDLLSKGLDSIIKQLNLDNKLEIAIESVIGKDKHNQNGLDEIKTTLKDIGPELILETLNIQFQNFLESSKNGEKPTLLKTVLDCLDTKEVEEMRKIAKQVKCDNSQDMNKSTLFFSKAELNEDQKNKISKAFEESDLFTLSREMKLKKEKEALETRTKGLEIQLDENTQRSTVYKKRIEEKNTNLNAIKEEIEEATAKLTTAKEEIEEKNAELSATKEELSQKLKQEQKEYDDEINVISNKGGYVNIFFCPDEKSIVFSLLSRTIDNEQDRQSNSKKIAEYILEKQNDNPNEQLSERAKELKAIGLDLVNKLKFEDIQKLKHHIGKDTDEYFRNYTSEESRSAFRYQQDGYLIKSHRFKSLNEVNVNITLQYQDFKNNSFKNNISANETSISKTSNNKTGLLDTSAFSRLNPEILSLKNTIVLDILKVISIMLGLKKNILDTSYEVKAIVDTAAKNQKDNDEAINERLKKQEDVIKEKLKAREKKTLEKTFENTRQNQTQDLKMLSKEKSKEDSKLDFDVTKTVPRILGTSNSKINYKLDAKEMSEIKFLDQSNISDIGFLNNTELEHENKDNLGALKNILEDLDIN